MSLRNTTLLGVTALAFFPWAPSAGAVAAAQEEVLASELARGAGAGPDDCLCPDELREYEEHLFTLASPWMEGRLPGTRGMELATEYFEFHYRRAGLVAPYSAEVVEPGGKVAHAPNASYRQAFEVGTKVTVSEGHLGVPGTSLAFRHGVDSDFVATSMGAGGEVTAPAVFVGYAVDRGPREEPEFSSFPPKLDLTGKIAIVLRFEPMDEEGRSRWDTRGWSSRAGFHQKLSALAKLGAAGAIIVNTPGADDPRAGTLLATTSMAGTRAYADFPVLHVSTAAGERLLAAIDPGKRSLTELRRIADSGPAALPMARDVSIRAGLVKERLIGENVVGILPGAGRLADEYVVVGAHLDHLGMGAFGSLDRESAGRVLHPGADDNASGSAGLLVIASGLAREFRALPADAERRSVVFIGFSAEESGLIGSRYYVDHPVAPIEQHVLMLNFDMIGRLVDGRLSVSGVGSGLGLSEFIAPYVAESPLTVIESPRFSGASDHTSFYRRQVPVLFGALADMHGDYHTPRDTSDKINCVDALHAARLFRAIASAAARRPEPFAFQGSRAARAGDALDPEQTEARLGIDLEPDADGGVSLVVDAVEPDSSAARAGIARGDRLLGWGDAELASGADLARHLQRAKAGDKVKLRVARGKSELELEVELQRR